MDELNWKIEHLVTTSALADDGSVTHANVVLEAHWRVFLCEATAYGSEILPFDPAEDFKPYEQLTEDEVVGWVKRVIGEKRLEQIHEGLVKVQPAPAALPWVSNQQASEG